uniref:hypothetical protein n=1 Tax=Thalassospira lucentensis TaxID=168935 RepID=UPI0035A68FDD
MVLQPINSSLIVAYDQPTPLTLEVHSHLDLETLCAVAFQSTAGLSRSVKVYATSAMSSRCPPIWTP